MSLVAAALLLALGIPANADSTYAELVNTSIGTSGVGLSAGFNFPGAVYPGGMAQFTPTFFARQRGFVVNQLNGAGCRQFGNFPMLPVCGEIKDSPEWMMNNTITIEDKTTQAGYYEATVADSTDVEITVSKRTGMARIAFPESSRRASVIIGSGIAATPIEVAAAYITGPSSCEGYAEGGNFCGARTPYKVYFVAQFSHKASETGSWKEDVLKKGSTFAEGSCSGLYFTFDIPSGEKLSYKFAISYVSMENARENLQAENPGWDFDALRASAQNAWNSLLGKIEVTGTNPDRITQFYTNLYHALVHPNICNDVNGEYMGADYRIHKSSRDHYTSFSNWDTYRGQFQLFSILQPDVASLAVLSLRDFAQQSGAFPRWVLANVETGIMQGDPTTALIADGWAFGARAYDPNEIFELMQINADKPGAKSQDIEERPGLKQYLEKGWYNASIQLEYTSSDFAIGQFALHACGDEFASWTYFGRAQSWKNLFNPETGWLQSRDSEGNWKDLGEDWRESTYTNYFWMVPYNLAGLIGMIGKEEAEKRLDKLFVRLDANYAQEWYACGNEPSFHIPWVYNWLGKPSKTSAVVNRLINEMYTSRPDGLPGNDDLGTMGAFYVFSCLGMFPVIPGVGGLALNTPIFESATLHLAKGDIVIKGGSETKIYTRSLKVNGESYDRAWIDWEDICRGAVLEYTTSSKSDSSWGTKLLPPSFE